MPSRPVVIQLRIWRLRWLSLTKFMMYGVGIMGSSCKMALLQKILSLRRGSSQVVLLSLREFSLTGVGFNDMTSELIHGLIFIALERWRLHKCWYADRLLGSVISEDQISSLKSLELSTYYEDFRSAQNLW